MFFEKPVSNILDFDRSDSVFTLFFLFVRDDALPEHEQMDLDLVLSEIFLGLSLPYSAKKKLESIYHKVMKSPPELTLCIEQVKNDFNNHNDALIAFVKILLRIISDEGMISRKHCTDLQELFRIFDFCVFDFDEFTDEEQVLISYALGEDVFTDRNSPFDSTAYNFQELYACLGCSPGASLDEIKKAYRSLAMKFHPDRQITHKNSSHTAEMRKFQDIQNAYSTLSRILQADI